jgi:hypothetical protein
LTGRGPGPASPCPSMLSSEEDEEDDGDEGLLGKFWGGSIRRGVSTAGSASWMSSRSSGVGCPTVPCSVPSWVVPD